jgi:hypothetical protein
MSEQAEQIIDKWCDNQDDIGCCAALDGLIRQDPSVAQLVAQRIDQHQALIDLLGAQTAQLGDLFPTTALPSTTASASDKHKSSRTTRTYRRQRHSGRFRRSPQHSYTLVVSLVSAALLAITVIVTQLEQTPQPQAWLSNTSVISRAIISPEIIVADSSTQITFRDGSMLSLIPGTHLNLDLSQGKHLHLKNGSLSAIMEPQLADNPCRIDTAHGTFTIIGTSFQLTALDRRTELQVYHGIIRVDELGKTEQLIAAGDSYIAGIPVAKPALASEVVLIPDHAQWHYYDQAQAPAANWFTGEFDATMWPTGQGPFGYKVNDSKEQFATQLNSHNSRLETCLAVWFTTAFTVPDAMTSARLFANITYDDGVMLYLNGEEVARLYLPTGLITAATPAYYHKNIQTKKQTRLALPLTRLRPGRNVLSESVHQRSTTSSDVYFHLSLTLTPEAP